MVEVTLVFSILYPLKPAMLPTLLVPQLASDRVGCFFTTLTSNSNVIKFSFEGNFYRTNCPFESFNLLLEIFWVLMLLGWVGVIVFLNDILSSCSLFARRECPHQQLLEKLCLFPQLSTAEEVERICNSQCCTKDILCSGDATEILTQIQQVNDDD